MRGENVEGTGSRKCTCPEAGVCEGAREAGEEPQRTRVVGETGLIIRLQSGLWISC